METGVVLFASHGRKYTWCGLSCLYTRDELFQSSGLKHHTFLCCFWNTSNNHTKMITCILNIYTALAEIYLFSFSNISLKSMFFNWSSEEFNTTRWLNLHPIQRRAGSCEKGIRWWVALQEVYLCVLAKFTAQEKGEKIQVGAMPPAFPWRKYQN